MSDTPTRQETQAPQRVAIMGATGSVGASTLDVIDRNPDRYEVFALSANCSVARMVQLAERHRPAVVAMADTQAAEETRSALKAAGNPASVLAGPAGLVEVVTDERCDSVMAAIVGGAGLESSFAAARSGKRLMLANKEALVMSGSLFIDAVNQSGAQLLPVDSEHNAIFQALGNSRVARQGEVLRILLTGSGGPMLRRPLDELAGVTPDEACAHPNWEMGRKISVDSATMMNKGLEVIEAAWLFDVPVAAVDVLIHPTSIVHSMVEFVDGSVIAQLGSPDMRTPIANALAWPGRVESGAARLNFHDLTALSFEQVDLKRFPCLALAADAAREGQAAAIALNAANEVAVEAFLNELIRFTDIEKVIARTLERAERGEVTSIEAVLSLDAEARRRAHAILPLCERPV